MPKDLLRVAVVTGHHPFDVIGFQQAFRALPGMDCYIQDLTDFASAQPEVRREYDVVVFYNMHTTLPGENPPWYEEGIRPAIEQLGETDQGLVVLHHALLAFPDSSAWGELVGVAQRTKFGYYFDQKLRVDVADTAHPITTGLKPWTVEDETYTMADPEGDGNHILLTTDHSPSMHNIAWTRHYRNARVFCYQSGHDNRVYANPGFRAVLGRGIQWCAGAW